MRHDTLHLVTLSGNSKRFTDKGYKHKALCDINGRMMLEVFIDSWGDFRNFDRIFLCRNEDLPELEPEIRRVDDGAGILGIESNTGGPVYSISQIFDKLPDDRPIVISYIDTIQQTTLTHFLMCCEDYDAGMTIHNFQNPHWRTSRSYCLVEFNHQREATRVVEKYPFTDDDLLDIHKAGSSGNYYFKDCATMKKYFWYLMDNDIKVNGEFYVTQAVEHMIEDGLKVRAYMCPYAALGVPEDLEDFAFWERWYK